jgi:hypothetical protein
MDDFVQQLDNVITPLQPIIFTGGLVALGVAAFFQISIIRFSKKAALKPKLKSRGFTIALAIFLSIVAGEFASVTIIKSGAIDEIRSILSEQVVSVSINGGQISNPAILVSALKNMCNTPAHHSHPTKNYQLTVNTMRGTLQLDLQKDSANPNEYWVYYPKFLTTQTNEVGRICTDAIRDVN